MVLKKSTVVKKSRRTKKKMDSYKFEDVLGAATNYFNGEDLPSTTWINKYCVKDSSGNYVELTLGIFFNNLKLFIEKKELSNQVDKKLGY